jgi:ABC-type lipoprotein export system ATPase subunit
MNSSNKTQRVYLGFVFQTFNLLATMTAFENVELPMVILGKYTKDQRKKRALELLNSNCLPFLPTVFPLLKEFVNEI